MRDRIRQLEEANSILHRENASLKSSLNGAESDLRHQRETITALQINVRNLAVENGDLRRSLEAYESHSSQHKDHERELRLKLARVESDNSALRDRNSRLETENKVLRDRIQGLIREVKEGIDERVKELGREVKEWRRRWEDSERRLGRMRGNWDIVLREREDLRIENSALRRANTLLERRLWRRGLL
jgi:chromosome segregation ATPase